MHAFELQNALPHHRPGQAISTSWTIRSLFPALLEKSETRWQRGKLMGRSFHYCPRLQSHCWKLDSKGAVANSSVWSQERSQNLVIKQLCSSIWRAVIRTRAESCWIWVRGRTLASEWRETDWILVIRTAQQWEGLLWEVRGPCCRRFSETERCWQGSCRLVLLNGSSEDQLQPTCGNWSAAK